MSWYVIDFIEQINDYLFFKKEVSNMITQRRSFGVVLLIFVAVGSSLCSSEALADPLGDRTVTVTCDPLKTPNFLKCDAGEQLTVVNGCNKTIQVSYNGGIFNTVLAGGSIQFDCTNNSKDCYTVHVPAILGGIESSTGCSEPMGEEVPTLTQYGLIALLVILAGIATWVVLKRRRVIAA